MPLKAKGIPGAMKKIKDELKKGGVDESTLQVSRRTGSGGVKSGEGNVYLKAMWPIMAADASIREK
jgi:hypothetical protein